MMQSCGQENAESMSKTDFKEFMKVVISRLSLRMSTNLSRKRFSCDPYNLLLL